MNLELINNVINNLKENELVQSFMKELSNYIENNLNNMTSNKNNVIDFTANDLTLYGEKITAKYKDKMLLERSSILQNYAQNSNENGEMYYVYSANGNSYNLSVCEKGKEHTVITENVIGLPSGSEVGSVLRKQVNTYTLDEEATKNIKIQINNMVKKNIQEQKQYLESKRIEGHIYEVGEKYGERIWLYDTTNGVNGGVEGIEEVNFPRELYNSASEGDKFIYSNGEYVKYDE